MAEPPTVTGARRDLGELLAALRKAAEFTQSDVAEWTCYSRSTVANVETGHQSVSEEFFVTCDKKLGANGALIQGYLQLKKLIRDLHMEKAAEKRRLRAGQISEEAPVADLVAADTEGGDHAVDLRDEAAVMVREVFKSVDESAFSELSKAELEGQIIVARENSRHTDALSVTLVGGYAGSGKSEFARFLSAVTGWTILDKDTLTRALVEQLLLAHGGDPNDRQTQLYLEKVRPYEYRCMLDAAMENLKAGVSTVLTAPFLKELTDPNWVVRFKNRCKTYNASFFVVWVRSDVESMYDYISYRGAARDAWKLAHWDEYAASINPALRPDFPHYLVDNSLNAAVALADQATEISLRMYQ